MHFLRQKREYSSKVRSFSFKPSREQVDASQVDVLIAHYQEKHGITIYKSGETQFAVQYIEKEKKKVTETYQALQQAFMDEGKKYYNCVEKLGLVYDETDFSLHDMCIGQKVHNLLKAFLTTKGYLYEPYDLRENLSEADQMAINTFIRDNVDAKPVLDELIGKYLEHCQEEYLKNLEDCNLFDKEAWEEIKYLQEKLGEEKGGETDAIGYVYTGGHMTSPAHFEVVIITNKTIIQPILWPAISHFVPIPMRNRAHSLIPPSSEILPVCQMDLAPEEILPIQPRVPQAQSDKYSCATLGFMYLKELLKNRGAQLKEYALQIPFYKEDGQLAWFFYPSPQVLRYSQSSTYNTLVVTMLRKTAEPVTLTIKKETYQIATLRGLLLDTKATALEKDNRFVIQHCTSLLNNLDAFRGKWIGAYLESNKKRQPWQDRNDQNQYLTWSQQRMLFIAAPSEIRPNVHKAFIHAAATGNRDKFLYLRKYIAKEIENVTERENGTEEHKAEDHMAEKSALKTTILRAFNQACEGGHWLIVEPLCLLARDSDPNLGPDLEAMEKAHTQAARKKEINGYARVADYLATLMEQIRQTSTNTSPQPNPQTPALPDDSDALLGYSG